MSSSGCHELPATSTRQQPAKRIEKTDTLLCQLINQHGENKGQGISYYQYNFPINIYKINRGDSIHIAIRHDMKREILPGVSDIGVKITKNDQ